MADCLFCAIGAGTIGSSKIYEDDRTMAFLDIQPLQRGHALVIPKAHAAKLEDASPEDAAAIMATTQRVAPALCSVVGASDATIAINDGPDAGQEVAHLHVHVIPRRPGDSGGPVHALFGKRPTPDADELKELAGTVAAALEAA